MEDGTVLDLMHCGVEGIMTDQEGNVWDLFGNALSGPRKGQQLSYPDAFMGYWFSFAAFYPGLNIY